MPPRSRCSFSPGSQIPIRHFVPTSSQARSPILREHAATEAAVEVDHRVGVACLEHELADAVERGPHAQAGSQIADGSHLAGALFCPPPKGNLELVTKLGYSLSSEEFDAPTLVAQAERAERAGFSFAGISDHFHPWIDAQGQSTFVWGTLGAISQRTERLELITGVTCPTQRIHPAIIAQAAATAAQLCRDASRSASAPART